MHSFVHGSIFTRSLVHSFSYHLYHVLANELRDAFVTSSFTKLIADSTVRCAVVAVRCVDFWSISMQIKTGTRSNSLLAMLETMACGVIPIDFVCNDTDWFLNVTAYLISIFVHRLTNRSCMRRHWFQSIHILDLPNFLYDCV